MARCAVVALWLLALVAAAVADVIVGGYFETADVVRNVGRLSGDALVPMGAGIPGEVRSLALYDGTVYTGLFGNSSVALCYWNSADAGWVPIPNEVLNVTAGAVEAMVVYQDQLVFGGSVTRKIGDLTKNPLLSWNGTAVADAAPFPELSDTINALAVYGDYLVVGGHFQLPFPYVTLWDGSQWQPVGTGLDNDVRALVVYTPVGSPSPLLCAGGAFAHSGGGSTARSLACWSGAGEWFEPDPARSIFNPGVVYALAVSPGGLLMGGSFTSFTDTTSANRLALLGPDGLQPIEAGGVNGVNNVVEAIVMAGPGPDDFVIAGMFTVAGPTDSLHVAHYRRIADAWAITPVEVGLQQPANIYALLRVCPPGFAEPACDQCLPDHFGPSCRPCLACTLNNGTCLGGITGNCTCPLGQAGEVCDECASGHYGPTCRPCASCKHGACEGGRDGRCVCDDGWAGDTCSEPAPPTADFIIGGHFQYADGVAANNVARWNGTAFEPMGDGLPADVNSLVQFNGVIVAGGAMHVHRWDDASGQWVLLANVGVDSVGLGVIQLIVFNNTLVAGGSWEDVEGVPARCIARWDGAAWSPLGSGQEFDLEAEGAVFALAVYQDTLIAGGSFNEPGASVAQWDGTMWRTMGGGLDGDVLALATYSPVEGNQLVCAGGFFAATKFTTVQARRLACWFGAAVDWFELQGVGVDGDVVFGLAASGPTLFIGGFF